MSQAPNTRSSSFASGTKSLIRGTRLSVRLPRRIVPICVKLPTGCPIPFFTASTPAMKVVLTAPRPTSSTPSLPFGSITSAPCLTGIYLFSYPTSCPANDTDARRRCHLGPFCGDSFVAWRDCGDGNTKLRGDICAVTATHHWGRVVSDQCLDPQRGRACDPFRIIDCPDYDFQSRLFSFLDHARAGKCMVKRDLFSSNIQCEIDHLKPAKGRDRVG